MTAISFHALDSALAAAWRGGAPDAYGMLPERRISDGGGNPCRHCLRYIPEGAGMLVLAHRPFPAPQPYAETGPIFLCADDCPPWDPATEGLPQVLTHSPDYLLKGYSADFRIVYGTGRVVPRDAVASYAGKLLDDAAIAFVDLRSARNNCFQMRICRRGEGAHI